MNPKRHETIRKSDETLPRPRAPMRFRVLTTEEAGSTDDNGVFMRFDRESGAFIDTGIRFRWYDPLSIFCSTPDGDDPVYGTCSYWEDSNHWEVESRCCPGA